MRRKNKEDFDQACDQHRHHHHRDRGNDLTNDAFDREERQEGRHSRQHRADHGRPHAGGRNPRRLIHRQAAFLAQIFRVFTDYNRVIHHNPQGHDQAKKRNHVDGLPHGQHHAKSG